MPQPRKPAHLRALSGDPERVAPNFGGGIGTPDPPGWMDSEAAEEWRRVTEACSSYPTWLQEVDRAALTGYCTAWSTFLAGARDVAERGPLVPARSSADGDALVKNPAVQVARDAQELLRKWARELGFTPDARGKVDLGEHEPAPSSVDDLLTGGA